MRELFRRLRYLVNRRRLEQELGDEMAFHREMAARDRPGGIGNTLRLREEARDAWGWTWLDRLGQDLRYAARTLRRVPGFSLAAVAMLGIGIGVDVAAFGFINAAFLRPLPIRDPASLLRFQRRAPNRYATDVPYGEMAFIRDHARTLTAVLAASSRDLTLDGAARPVKAQFVTGTFLLDLGASASLGRLLGADEDRDVSGAPAVVLSHSFWRRHFNADPAVVGRSIVLNNQPAAIVGVASPAFGGLNLDDPDMWVPLSRHPDLVKGSQLLTSFSEDAGVVRLWGRMRPDVTPAVVETELEALLARLRIERPDDIWEHERLVSEPGGYPGRGGQRGSGTGTPRTPKAYAAIGMIAALAFLILAVACANLGSLLVARSVSRNREIGIRIAVGAGPSRLIRQLLTESLLLASLGSLVGLGVGQVILRVILSASGVPSWLDLRPDWRVAAFTIAVTVVAAGLFGLAPAIQVARQRRRSTTIRQVLIGAQVAASCVLLIVAGLLVRAVNTVVSVDPGFAYQPIIAIGPDLSAHGFSPEQAANYLDTLRIRLETLPGVASVALASTQPLGGRKTVVTANVDGRRTDIHVNRIDTNFLRTMRIPLLRGRAFEPGETGTMLVSESLTRSLWPGQDPLGKVFDNRMVVGVVGSARQTALQDGDAVEAYFPIDPAGMPSMTLLVEASGRPEDVLQAVSSAVKAVDPDVLPTVEMLKTAFQRRVAETELTATAVSVLGGSALLLACVGIVGLVAFAVAQRTKEIGIRIALGATGGQVLSIVLRQLSRPVAIGLLLGTGAAAALSSGIRRELYGVSHLDPTAYAAAIGAFVLAVAIAAWLPARRALRIDPLRALRTD